MSPSPHVTPNAIRDIANHHVDAWINSDPTTEHRTLRDFVAEAITEALAKDYEARCRQAIPPHDNNNPAFVRHCAPEHATD